MKKYIDLVGLVSGILLLGLGTYAVWDLAVGAPERLGSYDMLVRGFRGTLPAAATPGGPLMGEGLLGWLLPVLDLVVGSTLSQTAGRNLIKEN